MHYEIWKLQWAKMYINKIFLLVLLVELCCFLLMSSLLHQSRTPGARDSEQDLFGKATFFMPAWLEENRGENERDCWWTTVCCWPAGGRSHPLWCYWQLHQRTDTGRCYSAYLHIVFIIDIVFLWSVSKPCLTSFSPSVWEECLLCGRPGSYNEAASSLANPFAPNSTLLSSQMQQQSNCYRSSCFFWSWICLHQQGMSTRHRVLPSEIPLRVKKHLPSLFNTSIGLKATSYWTGQAKGGISTAVNCTWQVALTLWYPILKKILLTL